MLNRRFYRLGLWIGGLVAPAVRLRYLPAPAAPSPDFSPDPRLDSVADAVVTCDASGVVTYANAPARQLFGQEGSGLSRLCYPSGQPVPPGQSPLTRTRLTRQTVEAASYLLPTQGRGLRVLDITARPEKGGTTAVFRDVTLLSQKQTQVEAVTSRSETLGALGARLGAAAEAEEVARAVVEGARQLLGVLPDAQACLYAYDAQGKRLTRLGSVPEGRPKRAHSYQKSRPPTFGFDASDALLWQIYVAKRPYSGPCSAALKEGDALPCYALPLLAAGTALGHLSLTFRDRQTADDDTRHALELLASLAALTLAGLHERAQALALAAQAEAIGEAARAVAVGTGLGGLADLVMGYVCRLTEAEVCTLAVREGEAFRLVGTAYLDALTFPERPAPDDAVLKADAFKDALRSGETAQRLGLMNPALEAGPWRAFAGQSGRHSTLTAPLPGGWGGWTVYWAGDVPLPGDQVRFIETMALLTAATMSVGRTGS